ncbi:MAG: hypothetical protein AAGI30_01765 [Planctomycetota bacterium]
MPQGRTGLINYRCPECLFHQVDYDLLHDRAIDQYYCRRCNWEGDEKAILSKYAVYKTKYADALKRWTVDAIRAKDEADWPEPAA